MTTLGSLAVVEIGGTSVKIGFADGQRPLDYKLIVPTALIRNADPVGALANQLRRAIGEAGLSPSRVVMTVPGFIDRDFDHVLQAANVPELEGVALASEMRGRLAIPVELERDVVLQLLGETVAGAVRNETHVLGVYFGTGIGAAYIGDGTVFRGGGWALELGHMPMHGLGRTLPGIGRDHAEVYASGRTLESLAARYGHAIADVFLAGRSDPQCEAELNAVVRDQAFAVATAIALLSPRVVLIGGGVVQMAGYPRRKMVSALSGQLPLPQDIAPLDLRWASLGWQAAIWGALSRQSSAR